MIGMERQAIISAVTPEDVFQILSDPTLLTQLLPHVRRAELRDRTDHHAHLLTEVAIGGVFGAIPCEGELEWNAPYELCFTVAKPMPVQTRWLLAEHPEGTALQIALELDLQPLLGGMTRFVPEEMVQQFMARELDQTIERLRSLIAHATPHLHALAA